MAWLTRQPWRRRRIIAANVLLPPVAIYALAHGIWWPLWVTLAVHARLLWAIFYPRCEGLGPVVSQFRTGRREVWLTLDDGPDGDNSTRLAGELHVRGVRATFFVIGDRLKAQPEAARVILAAGHSLANHSATHPRLCFWRRGPRGTASEVEGGAAALRAVSGGTHWFRAPAGHKPLWLPGILAARGARLIAWTVGGRDGWGADAGPVVARIQKRVRPGAIIMLHEGRAHSVATILAVVDALRAQGFSFTIPDDAALAEIACATCVV